MTVEANRHEMFQSREYWFQVADGVQAELRGSRVRCHKFETAYEALYSLSRYLELYMHASPEKKPAILRKIEELCLREISEAKRKEVYDHNPPEPDYASSAGIAKAFRNDRENAEAKQLLRTALATDDGDESLPALVKLACGELLQLRRALLEDERDESDVLR